MARAFCIPGIIFLFCAFVLLFLTSISLPFLTALDIARSHFNRSAIINGDTVNQLRLGVWAQCTYQTDGDRVCTSANHAYSVGISDLNKDASVIVGASWTRGLAIHPVATAVTFIALLFSFSTHVTVTLVASILSFLAALITLIAFAVDIALFAFLRHEVGNLSAVDGSTNTGPGFWLTFVSLILLLLAGCTVCFGRRRDRSSGVSAYPMSATKKRPFWQRFRRN